jgi:general secretion pathway protein H
MKTETLRVGSKGFTLIELIIVLLIIGIAATLVMFSAGRLYKRTVFRQEARKILQTIQHARKTALLERKNTEFKIDEESNTYWIDLGNEDSTKTYALPSQYRLFGETMHFFPKGNCSGGILNIQNEQDRKYQIEVDPVLCRPSIKRL